jgi:hypothetical protein
MTTIILNWKNDSRKWKFFVLYNTLSTKYEELEKSVNNTCNQQVNTDKEVDYFTKGRKSTWRKLKDM